MYDQSCITKKLLKKPDSQVSKKANVQDRTFEDASSNSEKERKISQLIVTNSPATKKQNDNAGVLQSANSNFAQERLLRLDVLPNVSPDSGVTSLDESTYGIESPSASLNLDSSADTSVQMLHSNPVKKNSSMEPSTSSNGSKNEKSGSFENNNSSFKSTQFENNETFTGTVTSDNPVTNSKNLIVSSPNKFNQGTGRKKRGRPPGKTTKTLLLQHKKSILYSNVFEKDVDLTSKNNPCFDDSLNIKHETKAGVQSEKLIVETPLDKSETKAMNTAKIPKDILNKDDMGIEKLNSKQKKGNETTNIEQLSVDCKMEVDKSDSPSCKIDLKANKLSGLKPVFEKTFVEKKCAKEELETHEFEIDDMKSQPGTSI